VDRCKILHAVRRYGVITHALLQFSTATSIASRRRVGARTTWTAHFIVHIRTFIHVCGTSSQQTSFIRRDNNQSFTAYYFLIQIKHVG